jgi:predicted ATPase
LKGFARPVPVWRVLGEAAAKTRFAATRRGKLPLVGRAPEMELMLDRWRLARSGEGQIVTVLGEAGIGKSRLVEALHELSSGEPHTRIYLQCSPYHRDSALYPVIQHLGHAARFVAGDSTPIHIEKLARLGREECAQLVATVATAQGLSAETVTAIVAKSDGVPLFVEELTKSVVESAGDGGATVPATLKDSLMARLDRLGDAREVAQIAAVIGRQFAFPLLAAMTPKSDLEIEAALEKLVTAGIVFPQQLSLERGFSFKHALVREAAYDSLLFSRRREWHESCARAQRTLRRVGGERTRIARLSFRRGWTGRVRLRLLHTGRRTSDQPRRLYRGNRAFLDRSERGGKTARSRLAHALPTQFAAEAWSGFDGHTGFGKRRSRERFSKGCGDQRGRRR